MSDLTPLDLVHQAMDAAPQDETARLRFFERLADSELFLLLSKDPEGEDITPEVFELSDSSFVLVFDREERLAEFVGRPAPYAALSGRVISGLLSGQGIGLAVNPEVAPSSILIPPEAVEWLVQTLDNAPDQTEAVIETISPPKGLPEDFVVSLDAKLATARGLAETAYLVGVTYQGGLNSHLLSFVNTVPGAEGALAKAVSEALTFSGIEAGALDVNFVRASDAVAAELARFGLRFDLPKPQEADQGARPAPGSDPENPPILR